MRKKTALMKVPISKVEQNCADESAYLTLSLRGTQFVHIVVHKLVVIDKNMAVGIIPSLSKTHLTTCAANTCSIERFCFSCISEAVMEMLMCIFFNVKGPMCFRM